MSNFVPSYKNSNNGLDEGAPMFMCCCGCIHTRLAVNILAILELVAYVILACYCIKILVSNEYLYMEAAISLAVAIIHIIIISFAVYGVSKEKPTFINLYANLQMLVILASTYSILYFSIFYFVIIITKCDAGLWADWAMYVIPSLVTLIYKIWSLVIIFKCCNYMKMKRKRSGNNEKTSQPDLISICRQTNDPSCIKIVDEHKQLADNVNVYASQNHR